jgi:hypothetical protein
LVKSFKVGNHIKIYHKNPRIPIKKTPIKQITGEIVFLMTFPYMENICAKEKRKIEMKMW